MTGYGHPQNVDELTGYRRTQSLRVVREVGDAGDTSAPSEDRRDHFLDEVDLQQLSLELQGANEALDTAIAGAALNEARYRALLDHLPDTAAYLYDEDHRVTVAAGAAIHRQGTEPKDLVGKRPEEFLTDSEAVHVHRMLDAAFAGKHVAVEARAEATGRDLLLDVVAVDSGCWSAPEALVVVRDVSERKAKDRALAAARHTALVEHHTDLTVITDRSGQIVYASPAYQQITGSPVESAIGTSVVDLVQADDPGSTSELHHGLLAGSATVCDRACRLRQADGSWRPVEVTVADHLDDPAVEGIVVNVRDITERLLAAERLAHRATHDPLTDLPNRSLLIDRLDHALTRNARRHTTVAVMVLDLDRFKGINDTLGHPAGDQVLKVVAARLRLTLRPADTVARLGSDEFAVLTEDLDDHWTVLEIAERLRQAVTEPITLGTETVTVGCSVGVAVAEDQGTASLLQQADVALYRAKERGRGRSELYDRDMHAAARRRHDTEQTIRHALDHDGIVVLHQPIIDLGSGAVTATEALVRLQLPSGTVVGPNDFIPVAEDTGLIIPLGAAVLDQACAQQATWAAHPAAPESVSVNVSARQLLSSSFAAEVAATLRRHDLPANQLCLELTESALIEAGAAVQANIDGLKALGVTLALDDFGTGWSSLAYLRRFPLDVVKIDRSFVTGLGTSDGDTEVVRAIIGLGHALSLTTVAEGVEDQTREDLLIELGCDRAQGYRYGKPAAPDGLPVALAGPRRP